MVIAGELLQSKLVTAECLRLLMRVLHHFERALIVNTQLVVVFDAWRELHAIGHVVELDLVFCHTDSVLCHIDKVGAIVNFDEFVAESGSVDDPDMTDLVSAIGARVCAVLHIFLETNVAVLNRCGDIVQAPIVTECVISAAIDYSGQGVFKACEHVTDADVSVYAAKYLVLDVCTR